MVKSVFLKLVLSPQLWLGAAAILVVGSFVVDYVDAQRSADRALALRQGPPPVAELQDYEPARNLGPAREVLIRAEADLGDPIVVTLGPAGEERSAVIYPLFPVSERGRGMIARRTEGDGGLASVRPVPRPDPEAARAAPPEALGVILHWADAARAGSIDPGALVARRFGPGDHASVVEVNGERVSPGDMALVVKGAMAARNLTIAADFLAISPYVDGRTAALAPPPSSGFQRALFWGGVTLALGALLLSVRFVEGAAPRADTPKRPGQQDRRVSPGSTPKARTRFQTIPTQDEIYATAQMQQARGDDTGKRARAK